MNEFNEVFDVIPLQVIVPIILLNLVLIVIALVDCIRSENTNGPKLLWVFLILFVQMFGPILYFIFGRGRDR